MKIDMGFWNENGVYVEDMQDVELLTVSELNLLQGQNKKLEEQNRELQSANIQARKIIRQDIEKFIEIEELCKLAKYKGGDDIFYDDILDVVQKWIYDLKCQQ